MFSRISSRVPPRAKHSIRYVCLALGDALDYLRGRRNPMVPPRRKIFIGAGDFELIGREFLNSLVALTDLQPHGHVLDVGSGQGRMALPLTGYLGPEGQYRGIEVVEEAARWCNRAYSGFPNFRFIHADVFNRHYNPGGRIKAGEYRFPFDDDAFDVVFLTSVFTHMLPGDVTHYLSEIHRCLKPGGRCIVSVFLLNESSRDAIENGVARLLFQYPVHEVCLTTNPGDPEEAIAYDERYLCEQFARAGLSIVDEVHYGGWVPRDPAHGFQDTIIARKAPASDTRSGVH